MTVDALEAEAREAAVSEAREAVRRFREDRDAVADRLREAEASVDALPPVTAEMTVSEVESRGVLRDQVTALQHTLDQIDHRIALNQLIANAYPRTSEGTD